MTSQPSYQRSSYKVGNTVANHQSLRQPSLNVFDRQLGGAFSLQQKHSSEIEVGNNKVFLFAFALYAMQQLGSVPALCSDLSVGAAVLSLCPWIIIYQQPFHQKHYSTIYSSSMDEIYVVQPLDLVRCGYHHWHLLMFVHHNYTPAPFAARRCSLTHSLASLDSNYNAVTSRGGVKKQNKERVTWNESAATRINSALLFDPPIT
ncbi:uncharacterized protein V6R79_017701 [Siganus canaliculatus]